jgi:hypothetical protein
MTVRKSTITDLPNDIRIAVPHSERNAYIKEIIKQAARGEFHDFKNKLYACGKVQLAHMLREANEPALDKIRQAVINGDYDESPDAEDKALMKKDWLENGGTEAGYKLMFGED